MAACIISDGTWYPQGMYIETDSHIAIPCSNPLSFPHCSLLRFNIDDRCLTNVILTWKLNQLAARFSEPGASGNPCSDAYRGTKEFSEVETRNVARYLKRRRSTIKGYMDIHAYSQLWMFPWGYSKSRTNDHNELVWELNILYIIEPFSFDIGKTYSLHVYFLFHLPTVSGKIKTVTL